eukprot:GILI01000442.1.p1 GENE.GILI01000442.1~~GILI01000442.1.p1  ORF type:complete len:317 (-),score=79.23 GILI01000442.1:598-1548(-)
MEVPHLTLFEQAPFTPMPYDHLSPVMDLNIDDFFQFESRYPDIHDDEFSSIHSVPTEESVLPAQDLARREPSPIRWVRPVEVSPSPSVISPTPSMVSPVPAYESDVAVSPNLKTLSFASFSMAIPAEACTPQPLHCMSKLPEIKREFPLPLLPRPQPIVAGPPRVHPACSTTPLTHPLARPFPQQKMPVQLQQIRTRSDSPQPTMMCQIRAIAPSAQPQSHGSYSQTPSYTPVQETYPELVLRKFSELSETEKSDFEANRLKRVQKFLEKRRVFRPAGQRPPRPMFLSRKRLASLKPRIKGRFVKQNESPPPFCYA